MSYVLYSEDGFVDDIGTNTGVVAMSKYIIDYPGVPALKQFVQEGVTEDPQAVVQELEFLLNAKKSKDIQEILQDLLECMRKIKEIAIISQ